MALTFDQAVAALTGPGAPFELGEADVLGRTATVFAGTPPSLRDLWDTLRARPDDVYLVFEDERWTFPEFMARTDAIAAALVDHCGVARGDRVAIGMRNLPEWVMTYAAVTSIGAVVVSLNAWWTGPEIEYGLVDSGTVVLVADQTRIDRIGIRLAELGVHGLAVRATGELPDGCDHLDDVVVPGAAMPQVAIAPDDDATILYTSGTTGHPKGAVSTHRAVLSALMGFACRSLVEGLRSESTVPPADTAVPACFILVVPLFHVTGSVPVMLGSAITGTRLVMMQRWDAGRALELIERERVTSFIGVPTMAQDLLAHPDFARRDTSTLAQVGGGGAPMAPELVRRIEGSFGGHGHPILGYGLTETNGFGPSHMGDDYLAHPASSGRLIPIAQIRVVDPAGQVLAPGEIGEIQLAGAILIRGYWNQPEATAEAFTDGWFRTGDLGYLDGDGFVFIVDRIKDMVLRGGENVYCAEVEAAIYEHPDVHEAAVFGLPHERLGEEVAAAVQPVPGTSLDPDQLDAFLAERIASFMVPTRWFVRDQPLPRGATGKILKRTLRDEVATSTS